MNIKEIANILIEKRNGKHPEVPLQYEVEHFGQEVRRILFPHYSEHDIADVDELEQILNSLADMVCKAVESQGEAQQQRGRTACHEFISHLPELQDILTSDADFIYQGDPASTSVDEVIAAYPGFTAILFHRIAHYFWIKGIQIFARSLSEFAHRITGIDIHPGAEIQSPFFIDHGTGIVIGETTKIGRFVKIYQGVTLGALSVDKSMASEKRHPTLEDNVVVYANATILGGDTIGHDSIIGGNVWLTKGVPPRSRVYHKADLSISTAEE